MKSFKKALAASLALAMVVTAVPATPAEAATTAKLNTTSVTVAHGSAKDQFKRIAVTVPTTWKNAKVKVSSSDKAVATVKASSVKAGKAAVKVTAVKKGTAKVTVKVTAKKGKKAVKKTLTATAKVINAGINFKAPTDVVVGSETKLEAKACPKDAKLTYASSDEAVATVDAAGTVKAVKAGKATITIKSDYGTTKTAEINVKNYVLKEVKQTKADTLEAVIAGDTSSIKAEDIVITNTSNNVVYAVKPVSVDATDKTKVTITTFAKMNDGKEYTVALDGVTKTFTATDNKAVAVKVTTTTIPYDTLSSVSAIVTDAQGITLAELKYGETTTFDKKTVEYNITPAIGGYTDGKNLYLAKKGDTATVKVTVKSGEYDSTGNPVNDITSGDVTITAVDKEAVTTSDFNVRISTESDKSYDQVKDNTTIAVGDTNYAYFKFTNSKKDNVTENYKVSSSNNNVLLMADGVAANTAVMVKGVAAGKAYIVVKDKDNNVVTTIPVTVNAKRVVNALTINRTSVVLSTATGVNTEVVKLTVKDQYQNDMTVGTDYTVKGSTAELLSSPSGATVAPKVTVGGNEITFDSTGVAKTGVYQFKVTVTDKHDSNVTRSQVVSVDVKAPTGTVAYGFELGGDLDASNTVDATLNDKTSGEKKVTVKVVKTQGGVKAGYEDSATIEVKKDNKGDNLFSAGEFKAIVSGTNGYEAKAAGTYVVTGKVGTTTIAPVTFTVENDTAKLTATQDKGSAASSSNDDLAAAFKFNFGGKELKSADSDYTVVSVDTVSVDTDSLSNVVYVKSITLSVKLNGTNYGKIKVDINKSVKIG